MAETGGKTQHHNCGHDRTSPSTETPLGGLGLLRVGQMKIPNEGGVEDESPLDPATFLRSISHPFYEVLKERDGGDLVLSDT